MYKVGSHAGKCDSMTWGRSCASDFDKCSSVPLQPDSEAPSNTGDTGQGGLIPWSVNLLYHCGQAT